MYLKNRLTSAPIGTFLANRLLPGLAYTEWARPRARGGASLVNLGTCITNKQLPPGPDYCISVGNDIGINALSRMVDTLHIYDDQSWSRALSPQYKGSCHPL